MGVSELPDAAAQRKVLASPFLDALPISGLAISVLNREDKPTLLYASDSVAARLEELHFDLGEGPLFDCVASGNAILVPDVANAHDWPMFLSDAQDMSTAALYVFPLTLGAVSIGAVLCHSSIPDTFGPDDAALGSALSRAIAGPALRLAVSMAGGGDADDATPIETRREVHQATGMVLLQLNSTATDAFARMRAYAFSNGISLREVAKNVLAHDLDFSALKD